MSYIGLSRGSDPKYMAALYVYGRIARRNGLKNYFDIREVRHIGHVADIMQRGRRVEMEQAQASEKVKNAMARQGGVKKEELG